MAILATCIIFGPLVGGVIANAMITRWAERVEPAKPAEKRPQNSFRRASDSADAHAAREAARSADTGTPILAATLPPPLNAQRSAVDDFSDLPDGFFAGADEHLDLSQFTARGTP